MKVFARLFQKAAQSRARSPCRLRRGETPFTAFSFCQAFSFGPVASKEKAEKRHRRTVWMKARKRFNQAFPSGEGGPPAAVDEEIPISDRKPSANKTLFKT